MLDTKASAVYAAIATKYYDGFLLILTVHCKATAQSHFFIMNRPCDWLSRGIGKLNSVLAASMSIFPRSGTELPQCSVTMPYTTLDTRNAKAAKAGPRFIYLGCSSKAHMRSPCSDQIYSCTMTAQTVGTDNQLEQADAAPIAGATPEAFIISQ